MLLIKYVDSDLYFYWTILLNWYKTKNDFRPYLQNKFHELHFFSMVNCENKFRDFLKKT